MTGTEERPLLTPAEVAERLGKDPQTIRRAINAGEIPAVQLSGRKHVPASWLESLTVRPVSADPRVAAIVDQLEELTPANRFLVEQMIAALAVTSKAAAA